MSTTVARKSSPRPSEPTMPSRRGSVMRKDDADRESLGAIPVLIRLHEIGREGGTVPAQVPSPAEVVTALEAVEVAVPMETAEPVSRSSSRRRRRHRRFSLPREGQPEAAAVSRAIDTLMKTWVASPTRVIAGLVLAGIVLVAVLFVMRNGRSQPSIPDKEPLASWPPRAAEASQAPGQPWRGVPQESLSGGAAARQARAEMREVPTAPPLTPSVASETAENSTPEMGSNRVPFQPERTRGLELQPAESWSSDLGRFPSKGGNGEATEEPASPASGRFAPTGYDPGTNDSSASMGGYPNTGAGVIADPRQDLIRTPVRTGMRLESDPGGRQQWNQPGSAGGGLQGTIDYPRDRERHERIGPGLH